MTVQDRMLHMVGGSAVPQRPDIALTFPFTRRTHNRIYMGCTAPTFVPETLPQLLSALQHESQNISQRDVQRLIASMRRCCQSDVTDTGILSTPMSHKRLIYDWYNKHPVCGMKEPMILIGINNPYGGRRIPLAYV